MASVARLVLFLSFLANAQNVLPQEARRPNPQVRQRLISPEILSDKKVTFRLYAPKADSVKLVCDWMSGAVNMTKNDSGLWVTTQGPLKPEIYEYSFNLDGVTVVDPSNPFIKGRVTYNRSILLVSGDESDLYSVKDVPHGTLSQVWYESPTLNLTRRMYVYTPAGYENNKETEYPVLYLLHGAGGDEHNWTQLGRAPDIMDNLIALGKAKPMLVVMTNGNAGQVAEIGYAPITSNLIANPVSITGSPGRNAFGKFEESLVKDVVPYIESHFRVIKDKNSRAIAGLSMGGRQAQRITLSNPDMFGFIGVLSMGIENLNDDIENQFKVLKSREPKLYWVGCGVTDRFYSGTQILVTQLKENGFNYIFRESSGGHTWANWRIYLSEMVPLLFK